METRSIKGSQPGDYNPRAKESEISWHSEDVGDGGFGEGPLGSHYLRPAHRAVEFTTQDFRGRGPKNYHRSDQRIFEDVCELLTSSAEVDAQEIIVEVSDGEILLMGTVSDHHMRLLAEKCIEDCPGVLEIVNQIKVQPEGGSHA